MGADASPLPAIVTTIYQDRSGLIWLGSREGLTLYDGYAFTLFEHDSSDPSSISDNAIRTLYEDRRGNLSASTNTGGLNRLDLATHSFQHFRYNPDDPSSLSYDSVYAIVEDRDGSLWVGTQRGLNRFDPGSGKFQRFLADPVRPGVIGSDYVTCLLLDRSGRLWVGTFGGGLAVLERGAGAFTVHRHREADPASLGDDSVYALLEDESGGLWVGTNSGLDRLDPDTGRFRHFRSDAGDPSSLSHPLVSSLAARFRETRVGAFGGGLTSATAPRPAGSGPSGAARRGAGLGDDKVISLLTDASGTLWIRTWGGGLARLRRSAFLYAEAAAAAGVSPPAGLADLDVSSLGGDRQGGLWIGTEGGTC